MQQTISSNIKVILTGATGMVGEGVLHECLISNNVTDVVVLGRKTSWLFKDDRSKYKNFMWHQESHDNSVDDEKDTTIQTWNYYYLFDFSKLKVDTLSKDEKELMKNYGNLLK